MSNTRKISSTSSRKNKLWDPGNMAKAIAVVREKKMGWMRASKAFNVPCGTLRRLSNKKYGTPEDAVNRKRGRPPILSKALEDELVQHCLTMEANSSPFSREDLREMALELVKKSGITHSFSKSKVGKKWLRLFLNRHPEIKFTRRTRASLEWTGNVNKNTEDRFFEAMNFVSAEQYASEDNNHLPDCDGSELRVKDEALQPHGIESDNECIDAIDWRCGSKSRNYLNTQETIQLHSDNRCTMLRTNNRRNHIEYVGIKEEQIDTDKEPEIIPLEFNNCRDIDMANNLEEQSVDPADHGKSIGASSQNQPEDSIRILPKLRIRNDLRENSEIRRQLLIQKTENIDLQNLVPCINLGQIKFFEEDVPPGLNSTHGGCSKINPKKTDDIVCMILSDQSSIATPHIEMNIANVESHNVGRSDTGEICIANCLQANGQRVVVVAVYISQDATIGEAVSFIHDALILYTIAGAQARRKNTHLRPMILGGEFNIDFGSNAALPLLNFLKLDLNLTTNRVVRRDNSLNFDKIIGTTFSRHLKDLRPPVYVSYSRHQSKDEVLGERR